VLRLSSSIFGVGLMSPMINNSPFVSDCCNSVSIVGDSCVDVYANRSLFLHVSLFPCVCQVPSAT